MSLGVLKVRFQKKRRTRRGYREENCARTLINMPMQLINIDPQLAIRSANVAPLMP